MFKKPRNPHCFASWDERSKTWKKTVEGKLYYTSCRQLGLPKEMWTKEASEPLARKYFAKVIMQDLTLANLTAPATPATPQPKADKSVLEQIKELREVVKKLEAKIG